MRDILGSRFLISAQVVFDVTRWETLENVRVWKRDLDAKVCSVL